jgi:hypothetical protein
VALHVTNGDPSTRDGLSLTERRLLAAVAGGEVLEGRADHVALNGVDRWIGGVRLSGRDVPCFDEGTETISAT